MRDTSRSRHECGIEYFGGRACRVSLWSECKTGVAQAAMATALKQEDFPGDRGIPVPLDRGGCQNRTELAVTHERVDHQWECPVK